MILIANTWTEKEVINHRQTPFIFSNLDIALIQALLQSQTSSANPFSDTGLRLLVRKHTHIEYLKKGIPVTSGTRCQFAVVPDLSDESALQATMESVDVVLYTHKPMNPVTCGIATIKAATDARVSHFVLNSWLRPLIPNPRCDVECGSLETLLKESDLNYTILNLPELILPCLRSFFGSYYMAHTTVTDKGSLGKHQSFLDSKDALHAITAVLAHVEAHRNACYSLVSRVCSMNDITEEYYARTARRLRVLPLPYEDLIRSMDTGAGIVVAARRAEYRAAQGPRNDPSKHDYGNTEALRSLIHREPRSWVDNIIERGFHSCTRVLVRRFRILRYMIDKDKEAKSAPMQKKDVPVLKGVGASRCDKQHMTQEKFTEKG